MSVCLLSTRSLALGFTMLLLERGGSHSCCFCTASLSSGRSKRNQGCRVGWGGGSISSTALSSSSSRQPNCKITLVQLLCVCYMVTSLKFPRSMRNHWQLYFKPSLPGSWATKTNPHQTGVLIHTTDLPSGGKAPKHS